MFGDIIPHLGFFRFETGQPDQRLHVIPPVGLDGTAPLVEERDAHRAEILSLLCAL